MVMNAQLHLVLRSELLEQLQKEALEERITVSELCRRKLEKNHSLNRIESMLEELSLKMDSLSHK